ncbi:MAG: pirin family protein [Chitinophagaceae bacterium]|nr:pirin family protein [Chitinophagaceae bacterium]
MNTLLHTADSRGKADHGWLKSFHTFSFSSYYSAERVHFGALRVLNDDTVAPGMGFGTHPHDNMEIISIPLAGDLEHRDSMGNTTIIREGDVQVMSAGTGIRHSEMNHNKDKEVRFLQIWIIPEKKNVEPRYDQQNFSGANKTNQWLTVVSPLGTQDGGVQVHQQTWFSLSNLEAGKSLEYSLHRKGNGIYLFILEGTVEVNGQELARRDGLAITETDQIALSSANGAEILLMEVPV